MFVPANRLTNFLSVTLCTLKSEKGRVLEAWISNQSRKLYNLIDENCFADKTIWKNEKFNTDAKSEKILLVYWLLWPSRG